MFGYRITLLDLATINDRVDAPVAAETRTRGALNNAGAAAGLEIHC